MVADVDIDAGDDTVGGKKGSASLLTNDRVQAAAFLVFQLYHLHLHDIYICIGISSVKRLT